MKNCESGRRPSIFGRLFRPEAFSGRRAMGRTGKVADGSGNTRPGRRQMDIFLDALAESSNVAASARAADRKSTRLNSSHQCASRKPYSALKQPSQTKLN